MPEQQQTQAPGDGNPGMDPVKPVNGTGGGGPGGTEAGIVGIVALALYLILFTLFVIYTMVKIWPDPTPSRQPVPQAATPTPTGTPSPTPPSSVRSTPAPSPTPTPLQTPAPTPRAGTSSPTESPTPTPTPTPSPSALSPVMVLWWQFDIGDEQRLLLLVLLGGALGTLVHSLRSVYWYIGNRNLVKSWMAMYFMLPFAGAALAMVFYLVVRGGFFSPQSSFQQTSPFGFAAFAALIGMFSSQAVLKLKDVAEVMLSKPLGGANAQPQGTLNPSTTTVLPPPIKPPPVQAPPTGGNPPVKP